AYPDFHGMKEKVAEIQALLIEPAATFNETKLFAACSLYLNQKCYIRKIGLGVIVEEFYVSKGLDFTTGFDLDDAGMIERQEWENKVNERLEEIVEALNNNWMLEIPPEFKSRLRSFVNGNHYGHQSDFVIAKGLLMDILPSNTLFDATKCLKGYKDFLNRLVYKLLRELRWQERFSSSDGMLESLWMGDARNGE
ncbi:hypothetical protein HDU99_002774, partial [Rhizoclosmatium hyalinum]